MARSTQSVSNASTALDQHSLQHIALEFHEFADSSYFPFKPDNFHHRLFNTFSSLAEIRVS